jgi:drug/metabolite transporter (DMT)-like permease
VRANLRVVLVAAAARLLLGEDPAPLQLGVAVLVAGIVVATRRRATAVA